MRMGPILIFAGLAASCRPALAQEQLPKYFARLQSEKQPSEHIVSWTQFGPGSAGYCEVVKYHPSKPDHVIMSPDMFNSYLSRDNGSNWQTINDCDGNSLGIRRLRDVCFSGQDPEYGLAIDERGWLWVTHDGGQRWDRKGGFPAEGVCSVITFDPTNDQVIYVGSGNFWNVKWNRRTLDSPHRGKPELRPLDRIVCAFDIPLQHNYQNLREQDPSCDFDPDHYSYTDYSQVSLTEYGKVWRSTNGGMSWSLINSGIPEEADIGKILSNPSSPRTLYMATSHGLFKSDNQGDDWSDIGTGLPHNMLRDLALHLDMKTGKVVLIAVDQVFWKSDHQGSIVCEGGVFRSRDEGHTWEPLNSNLYLDLTQVSQAIVGSYYKAIANWFGISTTEAKARYPRLPTRALQNFNRVLIDPSDPARMYLGHNAVHDISFCGGDLWKTEDGGRQWIVCNRVGPEWQGADKEFWQTRGNPVSSNMRFAHLQRQSDESSYGGRMGCRALTINSRGDLIAVMEQQTLQSREHGESWRQIDAAETSPGSECWIGTGCSNLTRPRYVMDARMPGKHFLLSGEHGLWQICDPAGQGSEGVLPVRQVVGQATEPRGPRSISTLAIHPDDPKVMYMQMYRQEHAGYIRKTTDGGRSWANTSQPIKFSISVATDRVWTHSLIIDRRKPEHMHFCVPSWDVLTDKKQAPCFNAFGVYHSGDGGRSWSRANAGLPAEASVNQLCFDPDEREVIYAAVLKSVDLKTPGGLYRSDNRGRSWAALPIPREIESVNHLCIDHRRGHFYIACGTSDGSARSGGVWKSPDGGQNWEKIFHMPLVYQVDIARYDPDRIAVAVGENIVMRSINPGAYLSFDGGRNWHKSNRGLGQPYWICDLQFDVRDPDIVWCGLNGSGWYRGLIKRGHGMMAE